MKQAQPVNSSLPLISITFVLLIAFTCVNFGCKSSDEETTLKGKPVEGQGSSEQNQLFQPGDKVFAESDLPHQRFRFDYHVIATDLPPEKTARVWLPLASTSPTQNVYLEKIEVPADYRQRTESKHGNRIAYFEAKVPDDGRLAIRLEYQVVRYEIASSNLPACSDDEKALYLQPNELVPTDDELINKLFPHGPPTGTRREIAKQVYERVLEHVDYQKPKGEPWGRGDAAWVCDSQFGNCSDFHSLFISICRSLGIPAYFEIGFSVPNQSGQTDIGGYHCWAYFEEDQHWVPVDISEADKYPDQPSDQYFGRLSSDRVAFSRGRDLELTPATNQDKINFMIYPHVEVDGKIHSQFEFNFSSQIAEEKDDLSNQ